MARQVWCCALVAALSVANPAVRTWAQVAAPPPAEPATAQLAKLESRIIAALDERTSLQFLEQPLADVVAFLEDRHNIEIQLDTNALDSVGANSDTPITIDVEGISLRSALNLALRSVELTYCVRDGVLLITTQDELESYWDVRTYDASRFMESEDAYGGRKRDGSFLIELITTHVEPTTWADVGGTGNLEVSADALVVSQSWHTQRKVGQFTLALETALERSQQGVFDAPIEVGTFDSSANAALRRALGETTSLQFREQPLSDIVAFLEDRHNIEIQLDSAALDSVGANSDTAATIDVEGLPLASALKLMLDSIELTYTLRDEVLLITTPDEVETELTTRIYPIQDLLDVAAVRKPSEATQRLAYQLFQTVAANVEPTTWTFVGGTGSVSYLPSCQAMIISQTQACHEEIENLLTQLRANQGTPAEEVAAFEDGGDKVSLRVYRPVRLEGKKKKPVQNIGSLAELIMRAIEPSSWNKQDPAVFIQSIDDALVIQQTNAAHDRIDQLFDALGFKNDAAKSSSATFTGEVRGAPFGAIAGE